MEMGLLVEPIKCHEEDTMMVTFTKDKRVLGRWTASFSYDGMIVGGIDKINDRWTYWATLPRNRSPHLSGEATKLRDAKEFIRLFVGTELI